jgi:hypothetical protein
MISEHSLTFAYASEGEGIVCNASSSLLSADSPERIAFEIDMILLIDAGDSEIDEAQSCLRLSFFGPHHLCAR